MPQINSELCLPKTIEDIDAAFMTWALRRSGLLSANNEVVTQEESEVGLTVGYFSAVKRVKCSFKQPIPAPDRFVVKTWPPFEALPHDSIRAMFMREIKAYQSFTSQFYPRPKVHLAAFDAASERWVLVMEDVEVFAVHKSHETELTFDEVMHLIPKMVDIAVAWEGCDGGDRATQLDEIGVDFWVSPTNLGTYKGLMPTGAKLFDKFTSIEGSSVVGSPTWPECVGGPGIAESFVRRIDAFFAHTLPANGATCTLAHGDLKGDNIFFCEPDADYPEGWLCIDFQMMFRGPVPSDLACLMSTGSVLPEVYTGDNLQRILRAFHGQFLAKTEIYKDYSYEKFKSEYAAMTTVPLAYYLSGGSIFLVSGAFHNQLATRVELGGMGVTEDDLTPHEGRQRMWWRKALANFRENFRTFHQYDYLRSLPQNLEEFGVWVELPDHLNRS